MKRITSHTASCTASRLKDKAMKFKFNSMKVLPGACARPMWSCFEHHPPSTCWLFQKLDSMQHELQCSKRCRQHARLWSERQARCRTGSGCCCRCGGSCCTCCCCCKVRSDSSGRLQEICCSCGRGGSHGTCPVCKRRELANHATFRPPDDMSITCTRKLGAQHSSSSSNSSGKI